MNIKSLEVKEISMTSFDPKTQEMKIDIEFSEDNPLKMTMRMERDTLVMVNQIVDFIKKSKKLKSNLYDDDFLAGVAVLQLKNDEEDLVDTISKSFNRIQQRIWTFKRTTEATTYMRQLDQMKTMKEVLYTKKVNR